MADSSEYGVNDVNNEVFKEQLALLERQFLCCYPLKEIDFELLKRVSLEQQEKIYHRTYAHALNKEYPIKAAYQREFLKKFLYLLEDYDTDIHDDLYEAYCDEMQQVPIIDECNLYAYKHYLLPAFNVTVTLSESKSFVAKGSTGLCSWQASLALCDYLLSNPSIVEHKSVLEIGAGTGLCGIVVKKCLNAGQFILTDGSTVCVKLMEKNIALNFKSTEETPPIPVVLQWGNVSQFDWTRYERPQLILAADVVYDVSDFPSLIYCIDYIFVQINVEIKMLLAATVRNEETLQEFLGQLVNLRFLINECSLPTKQQSHLCWDRSTQIKIFEISRDYLHSIESGDNEMNTICEPITCSEIESTQ